jgi:GH25 family lysozyme M1 (1,4-beta-N-acetylmuramidase)
MRPNFLDDRDAAVVENLAQPIPFGKVTTRWRVAESLLVLLDQANKSAPHRDKSNDGTIGDEAHQWRESDHNPWIKDNGVGVVSALDLTNDPRHGCDCESIAESLRAGKDPRIKYVIWNRRIFSSTIQPWTWRKYSGANPHREHIHISVLPEKHLYDSKQQWDVEFASENNFHAIRLNGIDTPHYEPDIDWNTVKRAGYVFCFTEATDSASAVDSSFFSHWEGMSRAGIVKGAYHFLRPTVNPIQQADNFLKTVTLGSNDLPPVLDVENGQGVTQSELASGVRKWIDRVESAIARRVMIYCSPGEWNSEVHRDFSTQPLWVAHYKTREPRMPYRWSDWNFWQYSETGKVPGVPNTQVDLNYFNGSSSELDAFIASTAITSR